MNTLSGSHCPPLRYPSPRSPYGCRARIFQRPYAAWSGHGGSEWGTVEVACIGIIADWSDLMKGQLPRDPRMRALLTLL